MPRVYDPVLVATMFEFVREARSADGGTHNSGLWVEAIQHAAGGQEQKDSWCMEAAWWVYCIAYQGPDEVPFPREQSVEEFHRLAIEKGWVTESPVPGDLAISINSAGVGHHIGIVKATTPQLVTSAGNTSQDGTSSNGDGWYAHPVSADDKVFVHIPE